MRCVLSYICLSSLLLWSASCSYDVDRSKICQDGDAGVTEEGYGLACTSDEQCAGNPTEGDAGATQCFTVDKLISVEVPDGGMPPVGPPQDAGDTGSDLDDFVDMLDPMLNICTDMACEPGGCPQCFQCCQCDMPISDILEMYGMAADPSMEGAKLDFTACVPVSVSGLLAMFCSCS